MQPGAARTNARLLPRLPTGARSTASLVPTVASSLHSLHPQEKVLDSQDYADCAVLVERCSFYFSTHPQEEMLDSQDYADFVARRIDKYIFWTTLAGFNIGERQMRGSADRPFLSFTGRIQHGGCFCGAVRNAAMLRCPNRQTHLAARVNLIAPLHRPAPQPSSSSLPSSPHTSQRSRRPELWTAGALSSWRSPQLLAISGAGQSAAAACGRHATNAGLRLLHYLQLC